MRFRPFQNIWIKILSLIVACVLWLHVATEQQYEHTFVYPLRVEGLPSEYVIGSPLPDSISVALKGRGKDLIKLLFAEGEAIIDASGFKYSERFIEPENIILRLPEVEYRFIGYTRSEPIRLVIDRYANREIPVKSALVLIPEDGYAADESKIRFEPTKIVLGGPENLIRSVEYAYTSQDTFKNLNTSTSVVVSIQRENNLVSYTPTKVSANIEVEPLHQITFEDIPVTIKSGKPRSGERLSPATIKLTFAGTETQIDSLKRERIQVFVDYIDVRTQGKFVRPVVIHPSGVNVVSMNPEYFTFEER
jgi:hypothetical protein